MWEWVTETVSASWWEFNQTFTPRQPLHPHLALQLDGVGAADIQGHDGVSGTHVESLSILAQQKCVVVEDPLAAEGGDEAAGVT